MGYKSLQERRRRQQAGSAIVEFALVVLPTFGFLFLFLNLAWVIFEWACVQEAIREGVRAAVTCSLPASWPTNSLNDYVSHVVEQYSFGFITPKNYPTVLSIQYLNPGTLAPISSSTKVASGDVVKLTISGLRINLFAPIMYQSSPMYVGAVSADVMACIAPITP